MAAQGKNGHAAPLAKVRLGCPLVRSAFTADSKRSQSTPSVQSVSFLPPS